MRKVLREKSIMTANFENAICETFMFTMPCFTQAILKFYMNISHVVIAILIKLQKPQNLSPLKFFLYVYGILSV